MDYQTEALAATNIFDARPIHIRIAGAPPTVAIWRGQDGWRQWPAPFAIGFSERGDIEGALEAILTRPPEPETMDAAE